jgi:uncharacterized protein YceK
MDSGVPRTGPVRSQRASLLAALVSGVFAMLLLSGCGAIGSRMNGERGMSLEEAQQAVSEDMRAAFGAAAPEIAYPEDVFGKATDCGDGEQHSTVRIMGNNLDDELTNDDLLERSTEYLQRHGWRITPEYTDSDDRSAAAAKEGVASGRLYAASGALSFTGETYCEGAEHEKDKKPRDPLAVPDSIEAAQRDTSAEIRGAIEAAVPGVVFDDDEYGEPLQCLRHSHRTTIRIAGAAAEGSHSEEELLAKAREYLEARDWVAIPQKTWDRSSPALGLAKTAVGNGELYPQEHGLVFDGQTPCVRDD